MKDLISLVLGSRPKTPASLAAGLLPYGSEKVDGSHDHRWNRGPDRTPAQKAGDQKRSKSRR